MGEEFLSPEEKNDFVRRMFNRVSGRYDFLNHVLSAGIDLHWRNRAVRISGLEEGEMFLDVACGTGDLSIAASKRKPRKIVAVDFAEQMLNRFREKEKSLGIDGAIVKVQANAEVLPFAEGSFDVAAVAFGVRNFGDLKAGLGEIYRVLKKNGRVVILEFSKPRHFPVKQIYFFYFTKILPFIGRKISGDRAAYSYLPASVRLFPDGKTFENVMRDTRFCNVRSVPLSFGIATAYFGVK